MSVQEVRWTEVEVESGEIMEIHCIPNDNIHQSSPQCWCDPEAKFVADEDMRFWIHRRRQ